MTRLATEISNSTMSEDGILSSSIDIDGVTLEIRIKGTEVSYRHTGLSNRHTELSNWSSWERIDEALKGMRTWVSYQKEAAQQTRETYDSLLKLISQ